MVVVVAMTMIDEGDALSPMDLTSPLLPPNKLFSCSAVLTLKADLGMSFDVVALQRERELGAQYGNGQY